MMNKQNITRLSLSIALAMLLITLLIPIQFVSAEGADKTTLDISFGRITIGDGVVSGYNEAGILIEIADPEGYLITGTTVENTITVTGGTHSIILSSASVNVGSINDSCALSIQTGATVNLTLNGTSELVSGENCAGIQVPNESIIVIAGTGLLSAQGGTYGAGIGGGRAQSSGSITISGGTVTAIGGSRAAGIGGGGNTDGSNNGDFNNGSNGGNAGNGGLFNISGGTVTATGGSRGAGIGGGGGGDGGYSRYRAGGRGGAGGAGGTTTISGGTITATGAERGAGIGGGGGGNGGSSDSSDRAGTGGAGGSSTTITMSGANVITTGGNRGAGIGGGGGGNGGNNYYGTGTGGAGGSSETVLISAGILSTTGGERGAGIGGGGGGNGGSSDSYSSSRPGGTGGAGGSNVTITISGGEVEATGGYSGAGIGGGGYGGGGSNYSGYTAPNGSAGAVGTITIHFATVNAQGGDYSAAIGGGAAGGKDGVIVIENADVHAQSGTNGAAIGGGGASGSSGTITISDSTIVVQTANGAGIGGGAGGSGGTTSIINSTVTTQSQGGAGIGGGLNGHSGKITVKDCNVTVQSQNGVGIGGGSGSTDSSLNIDGSTISAISQGNAGIGGAGGAGREIVISNSRIIALGASNGAGIGGGSGGSGGIINISSSTVIAQSGENGAAIGGGSGGSGGTISISSSTVFAQRSLNGAGIGGGRAGSGGTITIENNSTITALSQSGAGIGGGAGSTNQAGGSGGTILITSGDITALSQSGAGIGGGRGGDGSGSTYDNGSHGGSGGSGGSITIKNATVNAQSNTNGAGIGGGTGGNGGGSWHGFSGNGGSGGSGGTVILEDATVNAISLANGAGVGGGAGGIGGSTYYETSGTGGTGGSGGEIIIKSGNIIADGLTGIGGGAGGNGGNGISSLSGSNGGRGGNGGTGGLITINGGLITVPGISSVRINGGYGGSGGSGGYGYRGASGGNGGTGGIGGDIVITGGTIMPSGSGINSGIGGGRGGNGGNGGNASAGSSGRGPSGSAGAASVLSSCIVTGGSMNANIGCVPTTGGDTPVNVYFTVARLRDADQATIRTLSFVQDSLVDYGIQDMRTDADGRLYLYLPAYENLTTAEFSTGSMTYSGYNGLLRDSATFTDPNVLKLDQTPLVFSNLAERTFTFGDDVVLEYEVTGGTLVSGTVAYTFSGTDFSTEETFTGRLSPPANAGHYSLIATLPGDDYYHDATAVKRFFIVPKSMTGFTVGEISPITYTGAAVTPAVSVHDGSIELVSNRDFIVSCDNKNAGSQLALITGKGNYQGQLTKSFQITAKEITVELTVVPEDTTMVENDVVLTATIQGAVDNPAGTLSFKYNDTVIAQDVAITDDGSTYQATAFWNRVPAGTYTLTAEYVHAENDNYICRANGQIAGYEISKYAQPDFRFVDGEDHTIDEGTVQVTFGDPDFLLQTAGKLSSGSVIFSVESGHDVLTVNGISGEVSLLKSGTAIVRASCLSDDRYLEASAMINMTVAKAAQTGFAFPFPSITKVYGDEPFDLNASGGQSTFDVTYTVTEGDDVVSLDDSSNTLNILKAGTAVITATRSADDRYLEAITHLSITVEPDTPQIIEPPVVSEIAVIGTLASVTLSGGESNVPGRFVWNDPETIVTSSGLYELTFNPDDTVSYVSTSVHVPVSVTSILTHPGSGIQLDFSQIELPESTLSLALSVSSIPADSPVYAIIRDLASSDPDTTTDVRAVYDLTLKDQNGQVLSVFNAPLTVRIPVSDDQSSDLLVKWYDPITDTLTDMNTRLEDDFLVFETTHFSHYAVIRSTENPADPEPMPKAGEAGSMMFVYLLSLFAFVLIIRLIAFFGNRSRHARR